MDLRAARFLTLQPREDEAIPDLCLSTQDLVRFERALRALLSPLEHEDVDGWRSEVNRTLRELLDADMATFQLPIVEGDALFSDEVDSSVLGTYLPRVAEMDPEFSASLARTAELGVCNRPMLWGDALPDFRRSAYYNEFVVPVRAFDMLCAAVPVEARDVPAILYVHHESENGRRFGSRGLALMSMLHPALEAGVRILERLGRSRHSLLASLDAVADCVAVHDMDGRLLHLNVAFQKLVLSDREEQVVKSAAERLARGLAAVSRERGRLRGPPHPGGVRRIRAGSRSFSLRGSLLERSALGAPPLVLVLLREHGPSLVALDDRQGEPDEPGRIAAPRASIVARFGLTPRQTEVALLLARRKTNDEIAEALGISPHTARHHTQRVLRKMNVHSRREIASRLTEGSSDPRRGEG